MDRQVLDKRVVERYVRDGTITREQYEKYLEDLPDVSHLVDDEAYLKLVIPSKLEAKGQGAAVEDEFTPSAEQAFDEARRKANE